MFICIGDLRIRIRFRNVEKLSVIVLLGTMFIDRCLRSIFPIE